MLHLEKDFSKYCYLSSDVERPGDFFQQQAKDFETTLVWGEGGREGGEDRVERERSAHYFINIFT